MSLREKMNDNPAVVGGVVAGLVVLVLALVFWPKGSNDDFVPVGVKGTYFTEDNGKTFFVAPPGSIPGETKGPGGKPAFVAKVWQYPGEERQVGWVEHFTPTGLAAIKQFYSDPANKDKPIDAASQEGEKLVRRPGSDQWVRYGTEVSWKIMNSPQKNGQHASMVIPE